VKVVQGAFISIGGDMSRQQIVRKVVDDFISTEGSYWKTGTKFRYPVENLSGGGQLFIVRPGGLGKWNFDFKVEVLPEFGLGKGSHKHVVEDLRKKKDENPTAFNELKAAITELHDCKESDVDSLLRVHPILPTSFRAGAAIDLVLRVIKWLFIMEDVVYWNYFGRSKLYDEGIQPL